jgi:TusA-related sulfurtransferase
VEPKNARKLKRWVADLLAAQPIVPDKSIGLFCPMPIVKTQEALRPMAVGQALEMLSDDPSSDPDMKSRARRSGNAYRFLVRKVR